MAKASENKTENFDRFVQAMSRVLGISRKKLDKIMVQGAEPKRSRRRSIVRRAQ